MKGFGSVPLRTYGADLIICDRVMYDEVKN